MKLIRLLSVSVLLTGVVGCGGREMPAGTTGTVKGRLTIEGEPAPVGTVVLMTHSKDKHAATGAVKADGYFSMRFRDGTKLVTGIYDVGISPAGDPAGEVEVDSAAYTELMEKAGDEAEDVEPELPFALRYTSPTTSGEEFEVSEGANEFNLDLKK